MAAPALAILTILLATAAASGVGANSDEVTHRGKFELRFKPIQCVRAPCPAGGTYVIAAAGRRIMQGRRLLIDDRAGPRESAALGRLAPYISGAIITGTAVLVPTGGGTIVLRPTIVHGRP